MWLRQVYFWFQSTGGEVTPWLRALWWASCSWAPLQCVLRPRHASQKTHQNIIPVSSLSWHSFHIRGREDHVVTLSVLSASTVVGAVSQMAHVCNHHVSVLLGLFGESQDCLDKRHIKTTSHASQCATSQIWSLLPPEPLLFAYVLLLWNLTELRHNLKQADPKSGDINIYHNILY